MCVCVSECVCVFFWYIIERGVRSVTAKLRELGMIGGKRKSGKISRSGTAESAESEEEAAGVRLSPREGGREGRGGGGGGREGRRKRKKSSAGKGGSLRSGVREVARLVMSLSCHGYDEQLAWLEAYLRDEARDRSVDGEWVRERGERERERERESVCVCVCV